MRAASIFVRVGENGSFSAAAQSLGMSASARQQGVSRLEDRLGICLLHRTTRSVTLASGPPLRKLPQNFTEFEVAGAAVARTRVAPRGRIRIQLPRGLGRKIVLPSLGRFLQRYPEITVDVALDGRALDLAAGWHRRGPPLRRTAKLPAGRSELSRINYVVCASPDYIERHGEPQTREELAGHHCIADARRQPAAPSGMGARR